jgi:hypothetical protein
VVKHGMQCASKSTRNHTANNLVRLLQAQLAR